MRKIYAILFTLGLALFASSVFAGETGTLIARRLGNSADITQGKWHRNFTKAKSWAVANGVPFIAVWSNGDSCPHCVKFENCLNNSIFKTYEKDSGVVFWFGYPGDSEYKIESSAFHWTRGNKLTAYPFVRIYWPAGGVDNITTGDSIEGYTNGSSGSKLVVNYFKSKLKNWTPVDKELPYTIAFDVNAPADYVELDGNNDVTTMDSVEATYGTAVPVKNTFALSNYVFTGWATTAAGAVKYADGASVSKLTTVSNSVVTLFAKWAHQKYDVKFDANYTPTALTENDDREMDDYAVAYGATAALPANGFTRTDYTFAGWATTPTGSVVYKNLASVKNLTDGASVTLYAKWTQTTFRTWYTGVKATITKVTAYKGRSVTTTIPGMTWSSSTGKFTGTPKAAGTYRIGFKKSGATTVYRSFVIEKDAAELTGDEIDDKIAYLNDSSTATLTTTALSGSLTNCKATGLPAGMTCSSTGVISGRPTTAGDYAVKVTGISKNGQTLSVTYEFKVEQASTFLISGLAHFDELWAAVGEEISLPLRLRRRAENSFFIERITGDVEVDIYPDGGSSADEDGKYGTLAYNPQTGALEGSINDACIKEGFCEFKVEMTTTIGEGDDAMPVTWSFWLEVYEDAPVEEPGTEPGSEENP